MRISEKVLAAIATQSDTLDLRETKLKSLPSNVRQLAGCLKHLYLQNTNLSSLPSWFSEFKLLETLNLDHNQFSEIPPSIHNLENLYLLSMQGNRIVSLNNNQDIKKLLQHLRHLDLRQNEIRNIDPELNANLSKLDMLELGENPITETWLPEVVYGNPRRQVLQLIGQMEGVVNINECKVLILGEAAVGKTTLSRALLELDYLGENIPTETIGIEKNDLTVKDRDTDITFHLWDFGGQEIKFATHRFFLSKRSVYVLVIKLRDNQSEIGQLITKWKETIKTKAPESPIILIFTHKDTTSVSGKSTLQEDIRKRYASEGFEEVIFTGFSQEDGLISESDLHDIRNALVRSAERIRIDKLTIPIAQFEVKKEVQRLQREQRRNILTRDEFGKICCIQGIEIVDDQDELLNLLNDLGTVVYTKEIANAMGILEPNWATIGVYSLIQLAREKHGIIIKDQAIEHLKTLNDADYKENPSVILDLMSYYEIAFKTSDKYFIPDALDSISKDVEKILDEIDGVVWGISLKDSLRYVYEYSTWDTKIINLLTIRLHENIYSEKVWKDAVIFKDEENKCLIITCADESRRTLEIIILGPLKNRRVTLGYYRGRLADIHESLNIQQKRKDRPRQQGKTYEEKISDPENPDELIPVQTLLNCRNKGVKLFPNSNGSLLNVNELLGLYDESVSVTPRESKTNKSMLGGVVIFVLIMISWVVIYKFILPTKISDTFWIDVSRIMLAFFITFVCLVIFKIISPGRFEKLILPILDWFKLHFHHES